jgi:hypothetical protein
MPRERGLVGLLWAPRVGGGAGTGPCNVGHHDGLGALRTTQTMQMMTKANDGSLVHISALILLALN